MKKVLLVLTAAAMFAACNDAKKEETKKEETKTAEPTAEAPKAEVKLPYTSSYSSSFEIGNPAYAAMIEQGSWKDWETNNLDNMKNWMADTIVAFHSDNVTVRGLAGMMERWKKGRAGYTSVIDTIHAVVPIYSTDKKENWVLVWAKEINTTGKGKTDTTELMETWRINKDGKADMLLQYDRATRKK
jgi:hypothetical protein